MTHRPQPNIRRAKGITADTVRALLGLRHAGADTAYLPLERFPLADEVEGSAPLDPADVPACMRPDCDGSFGQPVIIGFDFASAHDQTVIAEYRDQLLKAVKAVGVEKIPAFPPAMVIEFISVPQPQPPQGCADEARSALLEPEPTAPTVDKRQVAKSQGPSEDKIAMADRLDRIREAAGKLALRNRPAPRPLPGPRNQRRDLVATADPIAQRRDAIERATRFLKSKAILVDILDRSAMIRRYRVGGKREPMLAEEVIEHARQLGMEEQG
jgi:hypothetical protein